MLPAAVLDHWITGILDYWIVGFKFLDPKAKPFPKSNNLIILTARIQSFVKFSWQKELVCNAHFPKFESCEELYY